MLVSVGCPETAKLAEYARGDLASADTTALEAHLADCRDCLKRCVELGQRSLVPDIPGCHVVREIGRGRFGVVYKAWWLGDHPRIVALKVLSCSSEMEESRFEREIAVLKKIESPGIVKCLTSGVTGNARYYVMDYVDGVHLDEYAGSSDEDLNEKLSVFQQVCRAVADAHARGVIHRDLKPRNILVDADDRAHILDFGICALETPDWSSWGCETITRTGDVVGTLKYMSPEQAWGGVAGTVDERSDLWALGVMLYEIVTGGEYPYATGSTPDKPAHEALLERIRKELPRLPRLGHLPRGRDLEVLLERCLAWEPARRIESAAILADDLERYNQGHRIKTRPLGLPYRLERLAVGAATRSRWAFSLAFVAMLGLILWLATYLFNVGWHVTGRAYQNPVTASAVPTASGQGADIITIVGVFDDTVDAVVKFASEHGFEGVTPSVPTWRAVSGYLMERLATARPQAVVWDYYFTTPRPGDGRLVAGIQKLENAGVPVVLAASTYHDDGSPGLSPGIVGPLGDNVRHGAIVARDMVQRPGEFVVAIKRAEGAVIPSLPLATLAAVLHPDARLDPDWRQRRRSISLLYEIRPGAYKRERDRIEPLKVFEANRSQHAVRAGDVLACNRFALERPEYWDRRTISYETLLSCPEDELPSLVGGKLVIFGDFRTRPFGAHSDRHRVKYGTTIANDVPGCYLLADAIAGLLDRRYLKSAFPLPTGTFACMLIVAVVGCGLPLKLAARKSLERAHHRQILWLGLVGVSAVCLLVMFLARDWLTVHLGMAGFALLAPMAGSFWVEFARNRHRILDRNRQAIEGLTLPSDGTITLASRPR